VLYAGVYSFISVCQLIISHFSIFINLHKPISEAQICFVFCALANTNTLWANRVGFASSLTKLRFESWLVGPWQCACKLG